ncbi:hypothetical protein PY793_11145 [Acetobacter fabarum]|uniref:hypothetical protein n=1 Tax=Acetobacter fabarum TaxID=483199 RepID=UPI00312B3E13
MSELTQTRIISKPTWLEQHPAFRRGTGAMLISLSILLGHIPYASYVAIPISITSLLMQCMALALLSLHLKKMTVMAICLVPLAVYWPHQVTVADGCVLYAASLSMMLFIFGRSLLPPRQPFVAVIASRVHGPLRADIARYTHALTVFWTIFFAAALTTPPLLFWLGPADAWQWPLSGGTFVMALLFMVVESGVRRLVIRNFQHVSLRTTVAAFRNTHASTMQTTASDA